LLVSLFGSPGKQHKLTKTTQTKTVDTWENKQASKQASKQTD